MGGILNAIVARHYATPHSSPPLRVCAGQVREAALFFAVTQAPSILYRVPLLSQDLLATNSREGK